MPRYKVDVDGQWYLVNVKQLTPGEFEIQAHPCAIDVEVDSDPTPEYCEGFRRMIKQVRRLGV